MVRTSPGTTIHHHIPGEVGLWVFVMMELFVFGVLFSVFVYERGNDAEAFNRASQELGFWVGAGNTLLLLTGSLFVALGMEAARKLASRGASRLFRLGVASGIFFGLAEIAEYVSIGKNSAEHLGDFYSYFFVYTGIHLLHVTVAILILLRSSKIVLKPGVSTGDIKFIEGGAVYWHFVDLIWVMLFATLYVMR
jgi:nitric oxide reductase NorE protein